MYFVILLLHRSQHVPTINLKLFSRRRGVILHVEKHGHKFVDLYAEFSKRVKRAIFERIAEGPKNIFEPHGCAGCKGTRG